MQNSPEQIQEMLEEIQEQSQVEAEVDGEEESFNENSDSDQNNSPQNPQHNRILKRQSQIMIPQKTLKSPKKFPQVQTPRQQRHFANNQKRDENEKIGISLTSPNKGQQSKQTRINTESSGISSRDYSLPPGKKQYNVKSKISTYFTKSPKKQKQIAGGQSPQAKQLADCYSPYNKQITGTTKSPKSKNASTKAVVSFSKYIQDQQFQVQSQAEINFSPMKHYHIPDNSNIQSSRSPSYIKSTAQLIYSPPYQDSSTQSPQQSYSIIQSRINSPSEFNYDQIPTNLQSLKQKIETSEMQLMNQLAINQQLEFKQLIRQRNRLIQQILHTNSLPQSNLIQTRHRRSSTSTNSPNRDNSQLKVLISKIMSGHSRKCEEMCEHLRRATELKRRHFGRPYPVRKTELEYVPPPVIEE